MFGGGPPEPTPEELRQQEELAAQTLYGAGVMCVVLYISPFIVDYVTKLV